MTDRISRARSGLFLTAGGLALLVSAGCRDAAAERAAADERAALRAEVEKLRKDAEKTNDELKRVRADVSQHGAEMGALAERVKAVEERPAGAAAAAPAGAAQPSAADTKARRDELDTLRSKGFDGTATEEEEDRVWAAARSTGAKRG